MFDISNTCLKKGCLEGEVAVITGSTSNVGKGFAQAIAWAGGKVVIVGRGAERGKAVADEINADNGEGTAIFVQADVSNADDIAVTAGGIPCGLLSVAIRNMHTPVETVDCDDVEKTAQLLAAYIRSGGIK